MAKFTDLAGRDWHLRITAADIRPLREQHGIDVGDMTNNTKRLSETLYASMEKFCDVVWMLIKKQAAEANVSEESFRENFDGDTWESASNAMLEALVAFSPRSKVATAMKGKMRQQLEAMDQRVIAHLEQTLKDNATNSLPSPESTPDPTASAS